MIIRYVADIEIVLGALFAIIFLLLHRPANWRSAASLSLTGWPLALGLLFVRSIVATTMNHLWRMPVPSTQDVWWSIGFLSAVDLLLAFMVVTFLRYRASERRAARNRRISPVDPASEED